MWLPRATASGAASTPGIAPVVAVGGEHVGAFEPVEQRGDVVRRLPHEPQLTVDPDRRAVGVAHRQQLLAGVGEPVEDARGGGDAVQHRRSGARRARVWRRLTSSCSSASSCIEHTIPISSHVARTSCGTNSGPL